MSQSAQDDLYPELLEALYAALPFVEDAESDPCFKKGVVKKQVRTIRCILARAEAINPPAPHP